MQEPPEIHRRDVGLNVAGLCSCSMTTLTRVKQVIIGAENRLEQMHEASLVLTRYGSEDEAWGVLGVLGPTRLPYWRAVPMVRFMAELMDVVNSRPGL